eukprot:4899268-Pyramimonas_sp.AAC.2
MDSRHVWCAQKVRISHSYNFERSAWCNRFKGRETHGTFWGFAHTCPSLCRRGMGVARVVPKAKQSDEY